MPRQRDTPISAKFELHDANEDTFLVNLIKTSFVFNNKIVQCNIGIKTF